MRTLRVALVGVVTSAVLVGCGADETSPNASPTAAASADASPTADDDDSTAAPDEEPEGAEPSSGSSDTAEPTSPDPTEDSTGTSDDSGTERGNEVSPETEMSVAPEAEEQTLSELVAQQSTAPLVRAPLPPAATAAGRLVGDFPALLRPPAGSTVESSSISPSGERLQVALVGATSQSVASVMRSYRMRLAKRGMTELAPPATAGAAQAIAFRRGLSRVTITVSTEGSRTTYSVNAVLHAGQD